MTWARTRAEAKVRATARARVRVRAKYRARGGKIISTALLIPASAMYTVGVPVLQRRSYFTVKMGLGGPNLMGTPKLHDTGTGCSSPEKRKTTVTGRGTFLIWSTGC